MVPVVVPDAHACKEVLRRGGFDAMSGRLCAVSGEGVDALGAARLAEAVHLPFDPDMPPDELVRLGELMTRLAPQGRPSGSTV